MAPSTNNGNGGVNFVFTHVVSMNESRHNGEIVARVEAVVVSRGLFGRIRKRPLKGNGSITIREGKDSLVYVACVDIPCTVIRGGFEHVVVTTVKSERYFRNPDEAQDKAREMAIGTLSREDKAVCQPIEQEQGEAPQGEVPPGAQNPSEGNSKDKDKPTIYDEHGNIVPQN